MEIKKRRDRVTKANERGEISIPIGHFALKDTSKITGNTYPKFIIYGLGSCVALILFDKKAQVHAMSHILLPSFQNVKERTPLRHPQKYADQAVKDLTKLITRKGATITNLRAVIIGGAKIFKNHYNNIGEENVKMVRHELEKHGIKIEKQVVGGTSGRNIKFDTKNDSIFVKSTGKSEFKKII